MRVGVEEAVHEDLLAVGLHHDPRDLVRVDARRDQLVRRRDLDAVDVLHREDPLGRVLPHDLGDAHVRAVPQLARDPLRALPLDHEIEFARDVVRHLPDEHAEVPFRLDAGQDADEQADRAQVRLDHPPDSRVLHLHRHIATVVRERTVHLRQRGRGDGLAREAREGLLRRGAQLAAHLRDHLVVGARGHGILQPAEHGHQFRRRDISATAEELARLDQEPLHAHGQPVEPLARRPVLSAVAQLALGVIEPGRLLDALVAQVDGEKVPADQPEPPDPSGPWQGLEPRTGRGHESTVAERKRWSPNRRTAGIAVARSPAPPETESPFPGSSTVERAAVNR